MYENYSLGLANLLRNLNEHQLRVVNYGAGLACMVGVPGCLDGDTPLFYKRCHCGKPIILRELYLKYNGIPSRRKRPWVETATPTYLRSIRADNTVFYNRVEAVIDSGIKACLELRTVGGLILICTEEHPLMLLDGTFVQAGALDSNLRLKVIGSMLPEAKNDKAPREGRRTRTVRYHPNGTYRLRWGMYEYKEVQESRLVVEAAMNKMPLAEFVRALRYDKSRCTEFKFLEDHLEVHHRDEDRKKNTVTNLQLLT
jgi:hypothetical protein